MLVPSAQPPQVTLSLSCGGSADQDGDLIQPVPWDLLDNPELVWPLGALCSPVSPWTWKQQMPVV